MSAMTLTPGKTALIAIDIENGFPMEDVALPW
jgi:hypothetical protein